MHSFIVPFVLIRWPLAVFASYIPCGGTQVVMAGLDHRTVQMRYVFLTIQWMRVVAIRDLDYYLLLLRLSTDRILQQAYKLDE